MEDLYSELNPNISSVEIKFREPERLPLVRIDAEWIDLDEVTEEDF